MAPNFTRTTSHSPYNGKSLQALPLTSSPAHFLPVHWAQPRQPPRLRDPGAHLLWGTCRLFSLSGILFSIPANRAPSPPSGLCSDVTFLVRPAWPPTWNCPVTTAAALPSSLTLVYLSCKHSSACNRLVTHLSYFYCVSPARKETRRGP